MAKLSGVNYPRWAIITLPYSYGGCDVYLEVVCSYHFPTILFMGDVNELRSRHNVWIEYGSYCIRCKVEYKPL